MNSIIETLRNVIIALSQPAPKYWGRSRRQLPIHSALLTYRDNHVTKKGYKTSDYFEIYENEAYDKEDVIYRGCNAIVLPV